MRGVLINCIGGLVRNIPFSHESDHHMDLSRIIQAIDLWLNYFSLRRECRLGATVIQSILEFIVQISTLQEVF